MRMEFLLLILCGSVSASDFYKIENVKRIDSNLYRSGDVLIQTRFCFELALFETVILKYEGPGEYSGSTVIWPDNSTCEVRQVTSLGTRNLGYVPGLKGPQSYDGLLETIASGGVSQPIPRASATPTPKPTKGKLHKFGAVIGAIAGSPPN